MPTATAASRPPHRSRCLTQRRFLSVVTFSPERERSSKGPDLYGDQGPAVINKYWPMTRFRSNCSVVQGTRHRRARLEAMAARR